MGVNSLPKTVTRQRRGCGLNPRGNVTSAGWQVTLCDPMWHVSSSNGVATLRTAIHLLLTYLLTSVPESSTLTTRLPSHPGSLTFTTALLNHLIFSSTACSTARSRRYHRTKLARL